MTVQTKIAQMALRRAQQHVVAARAFALQGDTQRAVTTYEKAERYYEVAGLDPDWFGDEHATRESLQRCIPGHE